MKHLKEILILGELPGNEIDEIQLYARLENTCQKYAERVFSPTDTQNFKGSDRDVYDREMERVRSADLVIAEVSERSTEEGMEIREAVNLEKYVLGIARKGANVPTMVKGCPAVKRILFYDSIDDLDRKLEAFLRSFEP